MSTNIKQEMGSLIKSVVFILGLSTISGLIIFFGIPFLITEVLMPNCSELACLAPYIVTIGLQWIMVIPAAIVVIFIYKHLSHQFSLSNIHIAIRIGIPLIFNIVGANSFFISSFIDNIQEKAQVISSANFLQDFSFTTIEDEKLLPQKHEDGRDYFVYNAVLQAENKTDASINQMIFTLVGFDGRIPDYQYETIGVHGYWGWEKNDINLPIGNSKMEINIEIYTSELHCSRFKKPLFLLYTFDDSYNSPYKYLAVNESITRQLKQIACVSTP